MGHNILAAIRDNLLLRASVATVAGIVLLGVASGSLPIGCFVRLAACVATPAVADPSAPVIVPNGQGVSGGVGVRTVAEIAPPTLTRNDVVAATFEMLDVDLSLPAGDGELKKRVVRTVAIGPDGQPRDLAAPPPLQVAAAPRQASAMSPASASTLGNGVAASGAPGAAAQHSTAVATELAVDPPAQEVEAPAAPRGKTAVVKNSGANVRSAPSKANSTVLFALPGGTSVSTGENRRGWIKVTDDEGRSGWVYEDLLSL